MSTETNAEPIITYDASGKPYAVFCGVCHAGAWRVASFSGDVDAAVRAAQGCCPRACATCNAPLAPRSFCRPCAVAEELARTHRAFEKAQKVALADFAGRFVSDGDEGCAESADARDLEPLEAPDGSRFLWGTHTETAVVDFEHELERWLDGHHEDACESVDYTKLAEAQRIANEALSGVKTIYADTSIAVLLPPPEEDDEERDPVNGQLVSAVAGGSS